jgi:hypothetical protein
MLKKGIEFILFLFYRHYNKGSGKDIAYLSSMLNFLFLLYMNLLALLIYLNVADFLPLSSSDPRWLAYLKILIVYFVPGYFIMRQVFKEDNIKNLRYDDLTIMVGNIALISYYILSIVVLIIVIRAR